MVGNKISKIIATCILGFSVLLILGFNLAIANYQNNFDRKHINHIGYLNPENPDVSDNFKRCSDKLPVGFYHSTAPYIYKGGKPSFRRFIQNNFTGQDFTDSGYLNFRFLIDCNGQIGDFEINQLDTNFEIGVMNKDLVSKLSKLTLRNENWNSLETKEVRDLYMYIIYKIENGKVVEILP